MEQYDIYGMGNALVDLEFSIPEAQLETLGIQKGLMTLVEEPALTQLLQSLHPLPYNIACGGSAGNTIITAQSFGANTFYSCRVASDRMGDLFYQGLIDMGVDTNINDHNRPEGVTGRCIVKITPDAERTMCTHLGITAAYSIDDIQESALVQSNYLYIEGYLVASPTARLASMMAKRLADTHQIKTAITLSDPNMIQFFGDGLKEMIGSGVELLFCNEIEALLFCGVDTLTAAVESLKKYARTFAITLGAKGALVYDGHTAHTIPSYPTTVLNTVGAGDVFAGAFLYALSRGHSYAEAGQLANRAAAKVVSKLGPRLTREESQALLIA